MFIWNYFINVVESLKESDLAHSQKLGLQTGRVSQNITPEVMFMTSGVYKLFGILAYCKK